MFRNILLSIAVVSGFALNASVNAWGDGTVKNTYIHGQYIPSPISKTYTKDIDVGHHSGDGSVPNSYRSDKKINLPIEQNALPPIGRTSFGDGSPANRSY